MIQISIPWYVDLEAKLSDITLRVLYPVLSLQGFSDIHNWRNLWDSCAIVCKLFMLWLQDFYQTGRIEIFIHAWTPLDYQAIVFNLLFENFLLFLGLCLYSTIFCNAFLSQNIIFESIAMKKEESLFKTFVLHKSSDTPYNIVYCLSKMQVIVLFHSFCQLYRTHYDLSPVIKL